MQGRIFQIFNNLQKNFIVIFHFFIRLLLSLLLTYKIWNLRTRQQRLLIVLVVEWSSRSHHPQTLGHHMPKIKNKSFLNNFFIPLYSHKYYGNVQLLVRSYKKYVRRSFISIYLSKNVPQRFWLGYTTKERLA